MLHQVTRARYGNRGYIPTGARVLALFALAWLVRLAPLNRYVTPDEPIWVLRSVAFADAVAARDWVSIPQTGHPGLTTMVLGALGIRVTGWLYPAESAQHLAWIRNIAWLAPENDTAFAHLAFFLPVARLLDRTPASRRADRALAGVLPRTRSLLRRPFRAAPHGRAASDVHPARRAVRPSSHQDLRKEPYFTAECAEIAEIIQFLSVLSDLCG
jgi:hypothetical protein